MGTLRIRGREYEVSKETRKDGSVGYLLKGKRGAAYTTMRNVHRPEMMFLIYADKFGPAAVMDRVWLSDAGGELKVVAS